MLLHGKNVKIIEVANLVLAFTLFLSKVNIFSPCRDVLGVVLNW